MTVEKGKDMSGTVDILIVEDNPDDLALTLRALKQLTGTDPVRTAVAQDGAEALDFLFGTGSYAHRRVEDRPKVVFLDLKLPKVSGLEVLQRIRQDTRTATLPVVIFTSSDEESDVTESYRLCGNSFITKPIAFQQFIESFRQLGLYWLTLNRPPHG
jgi:two-component system, response regulator